MRPRNILQYVALANAVFLSITVLAAPPDQSPRWVTADSVLVRSNPDAAASTAGKFNRGDEVVMKTPEDINGYCFVEGENVYGYVACKFLSAQRVERARAGADGVDAAQRWIGGNAVIVRQAPSQDAAIVGHLSLNAVVQLVGEGNTAGYCEMRNAEGLHGFTGCRYLSTTPVVLAHLRNQGSSAQAASPDYDPIRVFWLDPSWDALETYAGTLKARHPEATAQDPWPRDEDLERMKAHLALGIHRATPLPYGDLAEGRRLAEEGMALQDDLKRFEEQGKAIPEAMAQKKVHVDAAIGKWWSQLPPGVFIPQPPSIDSAQYNLALLKALEFPAVQPSLFRRHLDLAPAGSTAAQVSGRFGIVFRQLVQPRLKAKPESMPDANDATFGAGLYDMGAVTQTLTRPVRHIRLFRDGRLAVESSVMRSTEALWGESDGPECAGWTGGFSHGAADPVIWRYFSDDDPSRLNPNPPGSIYAFYTALDLPRQRASVSISDMKMDRRHTGFVSGTSLAYDLDGDGVPDLLVWEGQGHGPGHMGEETTTDDRWFRLVLVNIDGAWKLFGSDAFEYGCGC